MIREGILKHAYYDPAKAAIVLVIDAGGREASCPVTEDMFVFRDGMDKREEMERTAKLFAARKGMAITLKNETK